MDEPLEVTSPRSELSIVDEPTPEQIEARNKAFMEFWEGIKHLESDPDFSRLPIPYNYPVILRMIYKEMEEAEGIKKLTPLDIEKYNEIKEELKEKYDEPQEEEYKEEKKKKKRKHKKY